MIHPVLTGQTYPDPMAGASRSYIHRISELSSLEGDTVRQEKLKKMKKARKPPSWQSASSQSPRSRIKTLETVPTTAEQNKTPTAPCSFQWLALIACLSTMILFTCLTWLIFTFWDSWSEPPPHLSVITCRISCSDFSAFARTTTYADDEC